MNDRIQCLELLEEALLENHEQHTILFEIAPEIRLDKEVSAMIKYFAE
jgi:hypothetical protein